MKIRLILLSFLALALAACHKSDPELVPDSEADMYVGTVTVLYEGEEFDNVDKQVKFTPSIDGTSASLTIYKIRFVPKMPVMVNVTIPGIKVEQSGEKTLLSCDNVVPQALGGDYPKYLVKEFKGEISGSRLTFSLYFGEHPTSFEGTK